MWAKPLESREDRTFIVVVFQSSAMSHCLWPHWLQHARLLCPSLRGVCSKLCRFSQLCLPTTLSSVVPISSCLHSSPASGSFLMSGLFIAGGQSVGASASATVLLMNIQDWFPLGLAGLIHWLSKKQSSSTPQFKSTNSWGLSFLWSNSHIHTWLLEKQ